MTGSNYTPRCARSLFQNRLPIIALFCWTLVVRVGALPLSDLNSWLEEYEFPILIKEWRKEIMVEGWKRFKLSVKLKLLKQKIKDWVKSNLGEAE